MKLRIIVQSVEMVRVAAVAHILTRGITPEKMRIPAEAMANE